MTAEQMALCYELGLPVERQMIDNLADMAEHIVLETRADQWPQTRASGDVAEGYLGWLGHIYTGGLRGETTGMVRK